MYAPFVQKVDNAIHWINLYPVPRSAIAVGFSNNYPLDSLLSGGYSAMQRLNNRGRPVARFFYAEVRSNKETDQMKLKGQVSREGGALVVWDWIAQQVCSWAAHFERISVRQLRGPGACSPGKLLNLISPLKWLEMHLKLSWWGENLYTFSIKKRRLKKSFLHWNAWYNNYSPNRRRCSITEVYLHVELTQPFLLQYVCTF